MSKMTQREAVFQAISNVMGEQDVAYNPTKEQRAQVNAILFQGFKEGKIAYDGDLPVDAVLKTYVSGLQSNWLRKDKRLNGGVQYVAKNPGSRTGSTDAGVKAMRVLLATKTDPTDRAEIQSFIDKRLAEIKPTKKVELDVNSLPEGLRHLV